MRIGITGATGMLGRLLCDALLARGDAVVAFSRDPQRARALLPSAVQVCEYTQEGGRRAVQEAPFDAVVLLACNYGRQGESLQDILIANVLAPLSFAAAVASRTRHFIVTASALPPELSPYALSKAQCCTWLLQPWAGMPPCDVVRVQLMYGPADRQGFLTQVARACLRREVLALTDGGQRRDFVHHDDVVRALLTLMEHPPSQHRILDVGSGAAHSVRSVVERIATLCGSDGSHVQFGAKPRRPGEPECCCADLSGIARLGWKPSIGLMQGLEQLVASCRNRLSEDER